jgi:hypothetical protein
MYVPPKPAKPKVSEYLKSVWFRKNILGFGAYRSYLPRRKFRLSRYLFIMGKNLTGFGNVSVFGKTLHEENFRNFGKISVFPKTLLYWPNSALLYVCGRYHPVPAQSEDRPDDCHAAFSNGWIAQYAKNLRGRIDDCRTKSAGVTFKPLPGAAIAGGIINRCR